MMSLSLFTHAAVLYNTGKSKNQHTCLLMSHLYLLEVKWRHIFEPVPRVCFYTSCHYMLQCQIYSQCWGPIYTYKHTPCKEKPGMGGKWLLNSNNSELTSNFPFFSSGSTWASLDIAASLFGTPSPSISSTIITVSHFPKWLAGNMSDLMLSPKYTTCRVRKTRWQRGELVYCQLQHNSLIAVVKVRWSTLSAPVKASLGLTGPQVEPEQIWWVCKSHHNLLDLHVSFVLHVWKEKQVGAGFTETHSKPEAETHTHTNRSFKSHFFLFP